MKLNLTRRAFLKRSSLTAAALTLSGPVSPCFASSSVSDFGSTIKSIPTVCAMCRARCLVKGVVKNDRLHHIEGNSVNPFNGKKVCARGLASVKLLYDPDRLKYPLKRAGRRGEGVWTRISWQEAIRITGQEIKKALAEKGPEGLGLMAGGPSSWYIRKLFQDIDVPHIYDAAWHHCDGIRNRAYESVFGQAPGDFLSLDYNNAGCVVLIGSHLGENVQVPELRRFTEALGRGTQLIVVDPRYSSAANKADYYLPIRPGTDTALILGWLHHIIEKNLYDEKWIEENVEGFDQLKEQVRQYPIDRVAAITDIPALLIRETAELMSDYAPATIIHPGGHLSWYGNDVQRARSMAILTAVLGSWGAEGGIVPPRKVDERFSDLSLPQGNTSFSSLRNNILKGDVKVIGCWGQNPLQNHSLPYKTIDAFNKADFIFAADVIPSESVLYADIVFPEATFLERYDMLESWSDNRHNVIASRFPVVSPQFEARDPYWIVHQLSRQVGRGKMFRHDTAKEFLNSQLKKFDASLETLLKNDGFVQFPVNERKNLNHDGMESEAPISYSTPSHKIEVASSSFHEQGWSPVPSYEAVGSPPPGFFRLLYGRSPVRTLTQTCNNSWLHHESPENEIWVNDDVARTMRLNDGDRVMLENQDGIRSITSISVKVTPGIRQDCVFIVHGYGARSSFLSLGYNRGVSDTYLMTRSNKDPISGVRGMRTNYVRFVRIG
ncbi:MAG: molybdopterin-dependent oxidoreductase [Desulfobulbaceae bacterium]|uniref:Molybdopterin-dependent oxidoreductase n=1 Tax=Candidatus Desulfobia pelagia TaxID=2841692 RepID=A0A8J6TEX3_9BACT|nr:molybdopterin-dependent oxidoreductase [Candidatus Desulfobia pelagia]